MGSSLTSRSSSMRVGSRRISPTSRSFGSIPWTEPSCSSFAAGFSSLSRSRERGHGSPSRLAHVREESAPAEFRALVAIKPFSQPVDPFLQLARGHSTRLVIHIEERAEIPSCGIENTLLAQKPVVQRRPWKRREHSDLHVVQRHLAREREDLFEDLRGVSVETEDEAPVNGDPVR